jgi:hypothetical protein
MIKNIRLHDGEAMVTVETVMVGQLVELTVRNNAEGWVQMTPLQAFDLARALMDAGYSAALVREHAGAGGHVVSPQRHARQAGRVNLAWVGVLAIVAAWMVFVAIMAAVMGAGGW